VYIGDGERSGGEGLTHALDSARFEEVAIDIGGERGQVEGLVALENNGLLRARCAASRKSHEFFSEHLRFTDRVVQSPPRLSLDAPIGRMFVPLDMGVG